LTKKGDTNYLLIQKHTATKYFLIYFFSAGWRWVNGYKAKKCSQLVCDN